MPKRFNLTYIDAKGSKKFAAVIHRAPLGSHERFIGFLIEHFGGAFPLWLSPVQVIVLPITDSQIKYTQTVIKKLQENQIRVEIDTRRETLQAKIRDATLQKIPYLVIIGEKEEKATNISVRTREGKDLGQTIIKEFVTKITKEIEAKS